MVTPVDSVADVAQRILPMHETLSRLGVVRLAVFGSIVRNQALPVSDADILVEFADGQKTYHRLLDLTELLENCLGRPVDVVTFEALSPYIGPYIRAEAMDVFRAA